MRKYENTFAEMAGININIYIYIMSEHVLIDDITSQFPGQESRTASLEDSSRFLVWLQHIFHK